MVHQPYPLRHPVDLLEGRYSAYARKKGEQQMRCYCCDNPLSPRESTRRFKVSGFFTDMCDKCLNTISDEGIDTIDGEGDDEDLFDEDGNPVER